MAGRIDVRYPQGGTRVATSGFGGAALPPPPAYGGLPGASGGGGQDDMMSFFRKMAENRERERGEDRGRMEDEYGYMKGQRAQAQRGGLAPGAYRGGRPGVLSGGGDIARVQQARAAGLGAEREESLNRATMAGMARGMTPSTFQQGTPSGWGGRMPNLGVEGAGASALSKQVHLPQGSAQQISPTDTGAAEREFGWGQQGRATSEAQHAALRPGGSFGGSEGPAPGMMDVSGLSSEKQRALMDYLSQLQGG